MTFIQYVISERSETFYFQSLIDIAKCKFTGTIEEWFSHLYTEYTTLYPQNS